MVGRIIKVLSNDYSVLVKDEVIVCKPRGKFRNLKIKPVVGDFVKINDENYMVEILDRKNELIRPLISNIDQAVIVTSVKEPDFSSHLLDKLINIIEFNNIEPIIYFSKMDLLNNDETLKINEVKKYYENIGYLVFDNLETEKINLIFKDKVTVFTGQSGAGKSTLLNKLDHNLNILTSPISKALGRGKHTTRHVELFKLLDGFIADTPGFSALSFKDMKNSDIRDNFIEFEDYKENCKYKDCMHDKEDDCDIKVQVNQGKILKSRYDNYIKFINEER